MHFHQLLKNERITRGWSQAMMAQELGTTPNTISAWERGLSLPSPYFRTKLCTLLGKNAIELNLVQEDTSEIMHGIFADPTETASGVCTEEKGVGDAVTSRVKSSPDGKRRMGDAALWWWSGGGRWFPYKHPLYSIISSLLAMLIIGGGILLVFPELHQPKNPYGGRGSLLLNDLLQQQDLQVNWQEGWNENRASCQFKDGMYHAFQPLEGYFHACLAQTTNFTDFTYEVDMVLIRGDYGGLIFRAVNSIDSKYYHFRIYADGSYMLKRYVSKPDADALLLDKGIAHAFHTGYNQKNRLAVVMEGSAMKIYVNERVLVALSDTAYEHGQIGVFAGNDGHAPAEAAFGNVKVWSE